jgi:hypothetical protein
MVEKGGEDRSITDSLQALVGRSLQQLSCLPITDGRRFAFVCFGVRPRYAFAWIVRDGILVTKVIVERGQR